MFQHGISTWRWYLACIKAGQYFNEITQAFVLVPISSGLQSSLLISLIKVFLPYSEYIFSLFGSSGKRLGIEQSYFSGLIKPWYFSSQYYQQYYDMKYWLLPSYFENAAIPFVQYYRIFCAIPKWKPIMTMTKKV